MSMSCSSEHYHHHPHDQEYWQEKSCIVHLLRRWTRSEHWAGWQWDRRWRFWHCGRAGGGTWDTVACLFAIKNCWRVSCNEEIWGAVLIERRYWNLLWLVKDKRKDRIAEQLSLNEMDSPEIWQGLQLTVKSGTSNLKDCCYFQHCRFLKLHMFYIIWSIFFCKDKHRWSDFALTVLSSPSGERRSARSIIVAWESNMSDHL